TAAANKGGAPAAPSGPHEEKASSDDDEISSEEVIAKAWPNSGMSKQQLSSWFATWISALGGAKDSIMQLDCRPPRAARHGNPDCCEACERSYYESQRGDGIFY